MYLSTCRINSANATQIEKAAFFFHLYCIVCLVTQLYSTFQDPINCSQPGSSIHGILQPRRLEWNAIPHHYFRSNSHHFTRLTMMASCWSTCLHIPSPPVCSTNVWFPFLKLNYDQVIILLKQLLYLMKVRVSYSVVPGSFTVTPWTVCNLPGSCVHEILQATILEWAAIPGDLPDPEIEPRSPALQAFSLLSEPPGKP